jgi:iron-sulfur cluster assembly protein
MTNRVGKSSIFVPSISLKIFNFLYMTTVLEEKNVATQPIILTDGAVKQLTIIKKEQHISEDYGLRVGVKGGGCSGFSYVLGFDEQKDGDDIYMINGMKVLMQKAHGLYLLGMEVDFVDGLNNRGFSFTNPNAKDTCGCGTSFSA